MFVEMSDIGFHEHNKVFYFYICIAAIERILIDLLLSNSQQTFKLGHYPREGL